ncbi:hypothetical protein IQ06DRAFT_302894 [Phaeosphaeriaceae sp. SRC1lsM3a]|nr:hypothetical protein IQ06DRAFT_302894 [Stagonospora sp. SRC1lsM3a]
MRLTTTFISVLISVIAVAAQDAEPGCIRYSGGPNASEKAAVIAAFEKKYLPDGVYRPRPGEKLCIKCGNAEIRGTNQCAVTNRASREQVRKAFKDLPAGGNGCSNIIRIAQGADLGCLPVLLATADYYSPRCQFTC